VLDAWGAGVVLVETVGVGQDELEIVRSAHTTLVVMAPGMGDDVQAIKAGILECADVFAVNKADRDGADATMRDLQLMIALGGETVFGGSHSAVHAAGQLDVTKAVVKQDDARWIPPILKTVASKRQGVEELVAKLREHRTWLATSEAGQGRRRDRQLMEFSSTLRDALAHEVEGALGGEIEVLAARVARREIDPYSACELIIERFRTR
jgi:LAO/AO transport system kinase